MSVDFEIRCTRDGGVVQRATAKREKQQSGSSEYKIKRLTVAVQGVLCHRRDGPLSLTFGS